MRSLSANIILSILAAIALYYGVQIFVVPEIQELATALQNIRPH